MKKTLSSLLIVIILTNFIFGSVCYATPSAGQPDSTSSTSPMQDTFLSPSTNETTDGEPTSPVSNTAATDILEDGESAQKNGSSARSSTNSSMGGNSAIGVVMGYLALMFDIIPLQFQVIFAAMALTETYDANGRTGY